MMQKHLRSDIWSVQKFCRRFYNTTIFVFCQQLRAYFGCKAGKNKDVETSFDEAERHNARIFSFWMPRAPLRRKCRFEEYGADKRLMKYTFQ